MDPVTATLAALARHDGTAFPVAFAAGAVTSIGPCVAPRYIAVAALVQRGAHPAGAVATFVAGLLTGYAALGFGIGFVGSLVAHASAIDLLLAVSLTACGIAQLARNPGPAHEHGALRASGIFSLGAGSALIVSPCCTPIVAAVAGMGAVDGRPAVSALLLASFALGHAMPLLGLGASGSLFAARFTSRAGRSVTATISGALMLGLGAYYGVLA